MTPAQQRTSILAIQRAVEEAGSVSALARAVGVSRQRVWGWLNLGYPIPAECCRAVAASARGVTTAQLRPDIFG